MKDFLIICLQSFATTVLVMLIEIFLFHHIDKVFLFLIYLLSFTYFTVEKIKED